MQLEHLQILIMGSTCCTDVVHPVYCIKENLKSSMSERKVPLSAKLGFLEDTLTG